MALPPHLPQQLPELRGAHDARARAVIEVRVSTNVFIFKVAVRLVVKRTVAPQLFLKRHLAMKLSSLCVYCGSSPGKNPVFLEAARSFGQLLAERGISVIYGGGHVGLMGAVADGALERGGKVIGVIPENLMEAELGHEGVTELHVVGSMHERKHMMAERADGFVALPGGIGTLEELFEVLTWTQLNIHQKPCAVLNVEGFYDLLDQFLEQLAAEKFLDQVSRRGLVIERDPVVLLDRMEAWEHIKAFKWH